MFKLIENILLMAIFIDATIKLYKSILTIGTERFKIKKQKLYFFVTLVLNLIVFILGFAYFIQGRIFYLVNL